MHQPASPGERRNPASPGVDGGSGPGAAPRRRRAAWILFAALGISIAASDLWSKEYFFRVLNVVMAQAPGGRLAVVKQDTIVVLPGFFEFQANINYGAFSGWFAGKTWFLSILSAVALVAIVLFLASHLRGPGPYRLSFAAALGLLWGGTCGNLYDRALLGYVRDFIKWFFVWDGREVVWPNFNIADSAICIGVGLILLVFLFEGRKPEAGTANR